MSGTNAGRHRVLIIGGGYGGLYAARALKKAPVEVTLLDRRNHHTFSPLLYQVATGVLAPSEIAQPLRLLLAKQRNTRVLLGEAVDIDVEARIVSVGDGTQLPYDSLIVATGTHHMYFGHDEWAEHAGGLKTLEDALEMRARILDAFERAEMTEDAAERDAWLTFAIVGGGPTGLELAGALAEIARDALPHEFRAIDTRRARILLIEATERILPPYPPALSASAERQITSLGVTVRTNTRVVGIDADGVDLADATSDAVERLETRTVLWAAGVTVASFGRRLAERTGAPTDRAGRIEVEPDLTVPGYPSIFAVGDLARVAWKDGRDVPGVAQGGIQGGRHAARTIVARLERVSPLPFAFRDFGELATIGRLRAVADFRRVRFSGVVAWLLWVGIHITLLIGLQNRVLVFTRWAWSFVTRGRGSRLITHR